MDTSKGRNIHPSLPLLLGLLFIVFYVCYPICFSSVNSNESVWTPINSQDRICGDSRLYFSGVRERAHSFFSHSNPVSNNHEIFKIDSFRMASYQLMSVLSLGLSDARYAYFSSYLLSILLSFTLVYLALLLVLQNGTWSLMGAFFVLFYPKLFSIAFLRSFSSADNYLFGILANTSGQAWVDSISDHFRYMILSGANIWGWLIVIWSYLVFYKKIRRAEYLSFLVVVIVPYIYISHTIIFSLFLLFLWGVSFFKDRPQFYRLSGGILLALIILIPVGLWEDLLFFSSQKTSSTVMNHLASVPLNASDYFKVFKSLFLYSIPMAITLYLHRHDKKLQLFFFAPLFSFLVITLLLPFSGKMFFWERLLSRGFTSFWLFFVSAGILPFLIQKLQNKKLVLLTQLASLLVLISLPFASTLSMAKSAQRREMYSLPKAKWELYSFLSSHTKEDEVAFSFDPRDNQLIPVFTDLNLALPGAEFLESPKEQIKQLGSIFRYLNIEENVGNDWLKSYEKLFSKFRCMNENPFDNDMRGYLHLKQLLYAPYVKFFRDTPMLDEKRRFSQEFKEEYRKALASQTSIAGAMDVNYFIFDKDSLLIDKIHLQKQHFPVLFENSCCIVFRNKPKERE